MHQTMDDWTIRPVMGGCYTDLFHKLWLLNLDRKFMQSWSESANA